MVQIELSVCRVHFPLDLDSDRMDRSCSGGFALPSSRSTLPGPLQLVQQESRFYFIGRADRRVIFSVLADSLEDARAQFRSHGHSDAEALFIIKTETSIYLA
jgi:hypothetical protein